MQIQWKVVLLVFLALVGTTSAAIWKTKTLVTEDKINSITESNIKQIAPLRKLVDTKLIDEKETLVNFAAQAVASHGDSHADSKAKGNSFGDFDVVSLVVPNESGLWSPSWMERNPTLATNGGEARFPPGYELTLLKSLSYSRVKNGEVVWTRLSDRQGLPIYAMMMSVEIQAADKSATVKGASSAASPSKAKSDSALPETTEYSNSAGAIATADTGSGTQAIVVGFASGNPLATVTEDYIGSANSVYIIDDRGYVASHNNRGYLGALFSEDPVAKEITKAQKSEGTGRFEDMESQHVLSHYERIDGTNLYAVISTPVAAATGFVSALLRMTLITASLAGLAALLLAFYVGQNISESIERLSIAVQNVSRGGSPSSFQVTYSKGEMGRLSTQIAEALRAVDQHASGAEGQMSKANSHQVSPGVDQDAAKEQEYNSKHLTGASDKSSASAPFGNLDPNASPPMIAPRVARGLDSRMGAGATSTPAGMSGSMAGTLAGAAVDRRAAYEAFSEGLNDLIKQPLMSILGHVQLTRAKTDDPEVRAHVESIEREARRVRETMDRLRDFEAAPVALEGSQTMHLDHVVASALEAAAPKLENDDIEIERSVTSVPEIRGDSIQMQAALTNVIDNAREALKDQPLKKIRVSLIDQGGNLVIEIKDSGIGMSRDIQQKAFDPFFKSFDSPARLGLGLAFVASAVKRMEAKVDIDSSPGEGTLVRFTFPVSNTERASFEAAKSIAARVDSFNASLEAKLDDMWTATGAMNFDSSVAEGTLGGRAAVEEDDKTVIFPPMPPQKAQDLVDGGDDTLITAQNDSADVESASLRGTGAGAIVGAPKVPKQPPAGATVGRVPTTVREQRLANAMESIAAASSFFDDEDEAFSNVSLNQANQAMSSMKPNASGPRGASADGLEPGSQTGFKVKIRKPRVKS